jgi:hypothetical protein
MSGSCLDEEQGRHKSKRCPRRDISLPSPPGENQVFGKFITIKNQKFPDAVTKTAVIHKPVLWTLLRNMLK